MATKFYTFKKSVILKAGQVVGYLKGFGYYAKSKGSTPVPPAPLTSSQKVVQTALSQLGVKESPSGSNQQVYGVWYKANGEPWCAIFVSWCERKFFPDFHYAYVPAVVEAAKKGQSGLKVVTAPGDGILACYDWPPQDGVADHIGVTASETLLERLAPKALASAKAAYGPLGTGDFWAVEGNTAVGNESDGGEVMLRKRNKSNVQVFVQVT